MRIPVRPFTVGPILGAVSTTTASIWGRGTESRVDGTLQRLFGAARIRNISAGTPFGAPQYFKLNPIFDMTGVTVLQNLDGATDYEYQVGAIATEAEFHELGAIHLLWDEAHRAVFRTASADQTAARSFVFGSCRYLLRLFGGSLFDSRGDKTFRSINRLIDGDDRIDQILMLGDQIYADDLNFLFPDQRVDEYFRRYRDAFSQPHFANLVRRVPTYMTLDDHEIEDNWPAGCSGGDRLKKFPAAMHAYETYQLSHSPLFLFRTDGRLSGSPDHYWYRFRDGCCDFFVMDTRTERSYEDDGTRVRIIDEIQMTALKDWLTDSSQRVRFVATSVPFFPDRRGSDRDRWDSFAKQRNEILEHIRKHQIRKLVFLSGDVHSSMSAELHHQYDPDFKIISIVSSPFFWPYPHSKPSDFTVTGMLSGAPSYNVTLGAPVDPADGFTRVHVNPNRLRIELFGRKGRSLGTMFHTF